ncbi:MULTISPECIES: HNH endonuclease [Serratia]|jgi:Helix-turn-helix.|nr:HNH endonuclease [Serratia marcescens]MBI6196308.1 HNH endonuclease [Serratia marcescens]HEI8820172.1 HNH endonuclease [Serratia marcescens]
MSDCVYWEKCKDKDGYGMTFHNGKVVRAHRLAYCEANNRNLVEIEGLVVRHRCNNPSCVNPAHLLIGTQADNNRDRVYANRSHRPSGEKNCSAVLSESAVREIKRRHKRGLKVTHEALGREFGVSQATISRIISGKRWGYVKA